jgi:uncharacterized membrane protein
MFRPLPALLLFVLGTCSLGLFSQTALETESLTLPYLSAAAWRSVVAALGGDVRGEPHPWLGATADLPAAPVWIGIFLLSAAALGIGAGLLARRGGGFAEVLFRWASRGWRWWLLAFVWCAAVDAALILGWPGLFVFAAKASPLWLVLTINLWAAEWFALRRESVPPALVPSINAAPKSLRDDDLSRVSSRLPIERKLLVAAIALYAVTFTAMNWGLWFNLQVPHGDSAMYEEHLWNLEHGKGFRSYLDQGLFLGEHLQVIHALLIPLHLVWPSHLLLELCESLALAATAIPLYCIARRHTGSERAALYLAVAALLYFPLQTLDIEIDFKTFRPTALAVPVLLAAIDQMERRRYGTMGLLLLVTLSAQEDHAIPIALLGLWLTITGNRRTWSAPSTCDGVPGVPNELSLPAKALTPDPSPRGRGEETRVPRIIGAVMFVAACAYLLFAVKVAIPWFRGGATPHFARYFPAFGETPLEIAKNMLTRPGLLLGELFDLPSLLYAAYLLVPLGLLPTMSPGRLTVGAPLFVLLCLNEVGQDPPGPFHHFHAPLIPIVLWSAAAGAGHVARMAKCPQRAVCAARFALGCALVSGACYTLSPLGTRFWDPGRIVAERPTHWRALYLPDERARQWEQVEPLIPRSARVASTDFVHARLTHCERSYDYSRYPRQVAGYEDRVPEDTEYIVLDLRHPYSESVLGAARSAADVRELREQPERWELLTEPDDTYFVVLRRRGLSRGSD